MTGLKSVDDNVKDMVKPLDEFFDEARDSLMEIEKQASRAPTVLIIASVNGNVVARCRTLTGSLTDIVGTLELAKQIYLDPEPVPEDDGAS